MTLVAILTVRQDSVEKFRAFERKAASVMARYGGSIERTVVIPPANDDLHFREIHIVTFPDEVAFTAYRDDDELRDAEALRHESVVKTEIMIGEDGPDYHAAD
jgi:uncharacterized protein (DUF1330 family)